MTKLTLLFAGVAACAGDDLASVTAEPYTAPAPHLRELDTKAKAVFVGEIVSIEHRLSEPDANGRVTPFHFVTWRVEEAARGVDAGTTWTGRFAGGPYGDGRVLHVSEVPDFELGQRALVFAADGDTGTCALVDCRDGLLLVGDRDGARVDPARLDGLVRAFARPSDVRARSADPAARLAFTMPEAGRLHRPRATRRAPAVPSPTGDRELDALEQNRRNPVIP